MSQRHQKEETVMVKSSVWALGAIGLAAVGVVVGGWHPWMGASHVAAAKPSVIKTSAIGGDHPVAVPLTWTQARTKFPSWARVPGWVPAGVTHSSLTYGPPPGSLNASYSGSHNWTVMITENESPATYVAPHQTVGTLGGVSALIAQWHASPGGAHLTNIAFKFDGHSYDVQGLNISLAVAERVAVSLIHP